MATINGPFDFTGSVGNMRCYDDPSTGKRIMGKKGGYSKKQFDNLASLEPNRRNAGDFGGASRWASLLYDGLSDLRHLMHSRCFNQITSVAKQIQRLDVGNPSGGRRIVVGLGLQEMAQINFNPQYPFRSIIRDHYAIDLQPDKQRVTLHIPSFVPATDAWWMSKFLAVRIYLVVAQTADMIWNAVDGKYEPAVPDLEIRSRKQVSDWMVNNSIPVEVNLEVSLDEPAFSAPGTALVAAMGVEFSLSRVNGEPYALPHNGSMAIVKCWAE